VVGGPTLGILEWYYGLYRPHRPRLQQLGAVPLLQRGKKRKLVCLRVSAWGWLSYSGDFAWGARKGAPSVLHSENSPRQGVFVFSWFLYLIPDMLLIKPLCGSKSALKVSSCSPKVTTRRAVCASTGSQRARGSRTSTEGVVKGASTHMARFCPWSKVPPPLDVFSSPVISKLPSPPR
jgi:hypothetical protein